MLAIGCLIPLVLMAVGAVGGWAIGGQRGSIIGAVAGAAIGGAAMVALAWGWEKIVSRRE